MQIFINLKKQNINKMKDKRGKTPLWVTILLWAVVLGGLLYLIGGFIDFNLSERGLSVTKLTPSKVLSAQFSDVNEIGQRFVSLIGGILNFVVGVVPVPEGSSSGMGTLIVLLCVWGMMALAFGDIFKTLSFFSKGVSWGIAILLTIAAANLGVLSGWLVFFTKVFAGVGVAAVYVGLGASFVAFFFIETGWTKFAPWLMKRKAMQTIAKSRADMEVGSSELETTIDSFKKAGDALKRWGASSTNS